MKNSLTLTALKHSILALLGLSLLILTARPATAQVDLAMIEILSPANCDLAVNQALLTVSIKNLGTSAVSNFPVSFSKNSGNPVTETVTASIAPGATYLYTFNTKTNTSAGGNFNYTATVSHPQDVNTSNDAVQQQIFIMKKPNLGQNQVLCMGDVLYLYGGTLYDTWTWSTGATTQSININSFALSPGTYTYSITVTASACTETDSILITVAEVPEVDLGPDITIKLFGHAGVSFPIDPGTGFTSYKWSNGLTSQIIYVDNTLGVGTHEISIEVTDANGCIGRDTVLVRVIDDTGSEEVESTLSMDVYPNPGNGFFQIR
ncbi:MAG: hypothetical protein IH599_06375, partial [Bacteroidales bacterium]|nr:hypothetical protein [Bacteroidales bacterium]